MREALIKVITRLKLNSDFHRGLPSQAEAINPFQITRENNEQCIKCYAAQTIDRQRAIDDFQNDGTIKYFIASTRAMGLGITLTVGRS